MNLKAILLSVLLLSFLFAFPQRNCGTMQHHEDQLIKDPSLSLRMQDQEREIKNWIQNNINKQQPSIITIPVVVIIIGPNKFHDFIFWVCKCIIHILTIIIDKCLHL